MLAVEVVSAFHACLSKIIKRKAAECDRERQTELKSWGSECGGTQRTEQPFRRTEGPVDACISPLLSFTIYSAINFKLKEQGVKMSGAKIHVKRNKATYQKQ